MSGALHRVVIIGGGFGGLQAALKLARADVEVTLVDRRNFHLFQPLAYQVATGALSPAEIAYPLRAIFKRRRNVRVVLGEVTDFDLQDRRLRLEPEVGDTEPRSLEYDTLIVAGGSQYSYFGHDEWAAIAPELKSMESLLDTRRRILSAFEAAELADPEQRQAWLTFVVVGGGPTGVEMAGQIGEIARDRLRNEFREIETAGARIILAEGGDRVLAGFPPSLSTKAERALLDLGVTTLTRHLVVDLDETSATMQTAEGARMTVPARTVIWAAGVTASPLARVLAGAAGNGAELDREGRLIVEPDLTVPGHPEVFAIGDMVRADTPILGVAPVAMQQGRYAARVVVDRLHGRITGRFHYFDKGNVATIGRARAVADLHRVRLSGFVAWVFWLALHLWYLIGFQNRVLVFIRWIVSFITRGRGARLITGDVTSHDRELQRT